MSGRTKTQVRCSAVFSVYFVSGMQAQGAQVTGSADWSAFICRVTTRASEARVSQKPPCRRFLTAIQWLRSGVEHRPKSNVKNREMALSTIATQREASYCDDRYCGGIG